MQLIAILLITVSILTFLSGATVFLGATKGDRARSAWFFIATIFATVWMVFISLFLIADNSWVDALPTMVNWTFLSAIFIDIALLAYISWKYKYGKFVTIIFLIVGGILSYFLLNDHTLLYSAINITPSGNSLTTNIGSFYFAYIAFFCLLVPTVILTLIFQVIRSNSPKVRGSNLVLLVGFGISGTMSLIFNLILPLWTWSYVWVGPLAISTTIIAFYYSVLRYRTLNLASIWLKGFSYIVVIASSAVIYMVIFAIIFAAMFKGSTPSTEVIILNFIMIAIVLALLPATNELSMFIRSLISNQQIDVVYIVKKLTKIGSKNADLKELASFLAEHMHFEYIGFLVDGQVYGSEPRRFPPEAIKMITKLGNPEDGLWQNFDESSEVWRNLDLTAVAALKDGKGKVFGQFVIGKPAGKVSFSKRDITQVETIINLVAIVVDSKFHKVKKA